MYEEMGCPSIQIGTNLTHIKGGKALAFQQTLWGYESASKLHSYDGRKIR